jgi:hypothetical protein
MPEGYRTLRAVRVLLWAVVVVMILTTGWEVYRGVNWKFGSATLGNVQSFFTILRTESDRLLLVLFVLVASVGVTRLTGRPARGEPSGSVRASDVPA